MTPVGERFKGVWTGAYVYVYVCVCIYSQSLVKPTTVRVRGVIFSGIPQLYSGCDD